MYHITKTALSAPPNKVHAPLNESLSVRLGMSEFYLTEACFGYLLSSPFSIKDAYWQTKLPFMYAMTMNFIGMKNLLYTV